MIETEAGTVHADEYHKPKLQLWIAVGVGVIFCGSLLILAVYAFFVRPPADFPADSEVEIPFGSSSADIAAILDDAGYVRSETVLYAFLVRRTADEHILAGRYVFTEPLNVFEVAAHLVDVGPQEELLTLTFPEGISARAIASIADEVLPDFNVATFLSFAVAQEGYLFPDTYHVPEDFSAEKLYDLLLETGKQKLELRARTIAQHPLTEYEILTLASIIEREANSQESMRTVSSVLQNRLESGMPLQADASIEYVLEKPLDELVPEDLEIDTPYNTYLYTGLPPTPIGNPGVTAIDAVLEPADTDYFYYITGKDGVFHYAETFDAHRRNIAEYLR